MPGKIIILNGTPRSGKSSIVKAIQNGFDGVWMNLGVDQFMQMTPEKYQPGIGLRPGGELPELEPLVTHMYTAMYEAIASLSHSGLNVVVDVGHHNGYSVPRDILSKCAQILKGFDVLFVGVHCPIETIMTRRKETGYLSYNADGSIPNPILMWEKLVHNPGIYDIEVDTSKYSPIECAALIRQRMEEDQPPTAFDIIRNM